MEPGQGFAPQGINVGMFDKLQQANRLNDNGSWPYLRSHPLTTQRMLPTCRPAALPMAQLDYAGAVDRWRAAQDAARRAAGAADLIEASIVDTRLRQAQALLQQQRQEEQKARR
jgi:hypothetical protein